MLNDPDVKNVDYTKGDFVAFELSDGVNWHAFRVNRTALDVMRSAEHLTPLESFEENIDRIKGVAFAEHKVGNGYTVLTSDHFE